MRKTKRFLGIMLALFLLVNMIPSFSINANAAIVSRDDGTWLFPLSSAYYNSFTDWAGCPGWGKCPFHGVSHYGDSAHTWQANSGGHNGFDVGAPYGASVLAAAPGNVYYVNTNWNSRGYTIVMEHKTGGGASYYSYYQHLSKVNCVPNGSYVGAGTVIGKVGGTGGSYSYGNHLHFGIVMGSQGCGASIANMNTNTLNRLAMSSI